MNAISAILTAIEPWKGLLASVAGALAAGLGILGGIIKQRRVADTTSTDPAPVTARGIVRLHPDDRELISDARESFGDLTRAVRRLTGVMEDRP